MRSIGRSALILVLGAVAAAVSVPGCALLGLGGGPKMRLFVSNYRDDTVSVIEGDPEHEVKVLHVGDSPEGLALRNDPPLVAVANGTSSHVTLIDPVRMKILGTLPCSTGPEAVSFSADGKLLYVTSPREKKIDILDVEAGKAAFDSIAMPGQPTRLALSPDGRRLYVTLHEAKGAVLVFDTSTRRIVRRVPVGRFPTGLALSRDGRRLLAASFDDSTVTVIDTETFKALHTFPVDTGYGLVIHPTEPVVYSMDSFDDRGLPAQLRDRRRLGRAVLRQLADLQRDHAGRAVPVRRSGELEQRRQGRHADQRDGAPHRGRHGAGERGDLRAIESVDFLRNEA